MLEEGLNIDLINRIVELGKQKNRIEQKRNFRMKNPKVSFYV